MSKEVTYDTTDQVDVIKGLILVLSNHIGDMDILEQALEAAKTAGQTS